MTEVEKLLETLLQKALSESNTQNARLLKQLNGLAEQVNALDGKLTASQSREERLTKLCSTLSARLTHIEADYKALSDYLNRNGLPKPQK